MTGGDGDRGAIRGVIEGFYGPPWSWTDRAHVMATCHRWGMTHYVYAPKDDPYHRQQWRTPYPSADLDGLTGLVEQDTLAVGFAISPGLTMDYGDPGDRAALAAKIDAVVARGVRLVCLALDDIPPRPGLGAAHAEVTTWLHEHLGDRARLVLVPTEYTGTDPTPYLDDLAHGVPEDVPIAWTGSRVVCDEITVAEATARAAAIGHRRPLVWDNYPVNDAVMGDRLFTGPLRGRPPELLGACSGWIANPMVQPRASLLALASVAGWLRGEDPEAAWRAELGPLATFAEACDGVEPRRRVRALANALPGDRWGPALGEVDTWFRSAAACEAPGLEDEVGPWLDQIRSEGGLGRAAVRLVQSSRPVVRVGTDGAGAVAGPDLAQLGEQALTLAALWPSVRRAAVSVLGPRCGVRPVIDQWPDGAWRYRVEAVTEDANALDDLVRLALAAAGQPDAPHEVSVTADGRVVEVADDGSFAAPAGVAVTAHWGHLRTTVDPGAGPPLRDRRLPS